MNEISPELALVDPELAAEARSSLPEPNEAPPRRSRRLRKALGACMLALGLAAASAAFLLMRGVSDDTRPRASGAPTTAAVLGARKAAAPLPTLVRPGRAARLYTWEAKGGAVFYQVAFVRNGKPFHTAETPNAWLRVPETLRFPPGTYRWSVRPAIADESGIVVGDAVVVRTFRVTGG